MKKLSFVVLLAFVPMLTMCRPADVRPHFKNCNYNGASSGTVVKLTCRGKGDNHGTALTDARKAAAFTVASRMLMSGADRAKFSMIERRFFLAHRNFVRSCTTNGTIQQDDDGSVLVMAFCNVDRTQVVAFLKDNGVINPQQTREDVGNPTVAVVTKWSTHDESWNELVKNSASEFLTSRKYNALDLSSGTKNLKTLEQKILKSDNIPIDKKYRAAMMMGADVYVELAARNDIKGPNVRGIAAVKAYETTTGRLLASSSSFGRQYPLSIAGAQQKTVKESIQNAMEKVLTQVMGYWRDDVPKGNRYYITLAGQLNAVEDMSDHINLKLKRIPNVTNVKCPTITQQRMICTFRSKGDVAELRLNIKTALRRSPGVRSVSRRIATRKFFLFTINHSAPSGSPDSLPPGL